MKIFNFIKNICFFALITQINVNASMLYQKNFSNNLYDVFHMISNCAKNNSDVSTIASNIIKFSAVLAEIPAVAFYTRKSIVRDIKNDENIENLVKYIINQYQFLETLDKQIKFNFAYKVIDLCLDDLEKQSSIVLLKKILKMSTVQEIQRYKNKLKFIEGSKIIYNTYDNLKTIAINLNDNSNKMIYRNFNGNINLPNNKMVVKITEKLYKSIVQTFGISLNEYFKNEVSSKVAKNIFIWNSFAYDANAYYAQIRKICEKHPDVQKQIGANVKGFGFGKIRLDNLSEEVKNVMKKEIIWLQCDESETLIDTFLNLYK